MLDANTRRTWFLRTTMVNPDMPTFTWNTWQVSGYLTVGVGYFLDIPATFGDHREAATFDPYIPSPLLLGTRDKMTLLLVTCPFLLSQTTYQSYTVGEGEGRGGGGYRSL